MIFVMDHEYECKPLGIKKEKDTEETERKSEGLRLRQTGEVLASSWTLMQP
jgi:hypothetical protein